jgi:hypothetical protein
VCKCRDSTFKQTMTTYCHILSASLTSLYNLMLYNLFSLMKC